MVNSTKVNSTKVNSTKVNSTKANSTKANKLDVRAKAEIKERPFNGRVIEIDFPVEWLTYDEIMRLAKDEVVLIRTRNA